MEQDFAEEVSVKQSDHPTRGEHDVLLASAYLFIKGGKSAASRTAAAAAIMDGPKAAFKAHCQG